MPYFSQSKAAKIAGVSRSTISNRIKDGTLSTTSDGIELSELLRVYPDGDARRARKGSGLVSRDTLERQDLLYRELLDQKTATLDAQTNELRVLRQTAEEQHKATSRALQQLRIKETRLEQAQGRIDQLTDQVTGLLDVDREIPVLTARAAIPTPKKPPKSRLRRTVDSMMPWNWENETVT